jgi:hypothetical protein
VSEKVKRFRGNSLWRLWWHLWRLSPFFYSKDAAKVL